MVQIKKQKPVDIRKSGLQNWRQLQQQNNAIQSGYDPEVAQYLQELNIKRPLRHMMNPEEAAPHVVQSPLYNTNTKLGESMFDEDVYSPEQFQDAADVRAENQPWYSQLGAGIAKGAVLAGTTFLDGTMGLLYGGAKAIEEGRVGALWDNDFSKAMQSINDWSEKEMPNYYTQQEQDASIWDKLFTANFWGDSFIKNLGFTVGAFYSGGLEAGAIKGLGRLAMTGAKNLGATISTIKNIAQTSQATASILGSFTSAVNEGRIEALNNSREYYKAVSSDLLNQHNERLKSIQDNYYGTELYNTLIAQENDNYNKAMTKLSEDRVHMGNVDLALNIPILTISNLIQFGKMYGRGFKTARRAQQIENNIGGRGITGTLGHYAPETTKKEIYTAALKSPISEGMEEVNQQLASNISADYYKTDVDNYYKTLTDPNNRQEANSWLKASMQAFTETMGDQSTWEQFLVGAMTGAMGMPRFRSFTKEGKFQSPITIEGGILGEYRDVTQRIAREQAIADKLNERVNSPEFKAYYDGYVRHQGFQRAMNNATQNNDEFEFKNAENAQLISDITMFDSVGKLDDLVEMINQGLSDTSSENIESIIKNTGRQVSKDEQVNQLTEQLNANQQAQANTNDASELVRLKQEEVDIQHKINTAKDYYISPYTDENGNKLSDEEIANQMNKAKTEFLDKINEYKQIKNDLIEASNDSLSDEQLNDLIYLKSSLSDWKDRGTSIRDKNKDVVSKIIKQLTDVRTVLNDNNSRLTSEKDAKEYNRNKRKLEDIENTIKVLEIFNNSENPDLLISNEGINVKALKDIAKNSLGIDADEYNRFSKDLNDLIKIGKARKSYKEKLIEYMLNPGKIDEAHANVDNQNQRKQKDLDVRRILDKVSNATTYKDIDDIFKEENIEDASILTSNNTELGSTYAKSKSFMNSVNNAIDKLDIDDDDKEKLKAYAQKKYNNSTSYEELTNPDYQITDNEDLLTNDYYTQQLNNAMVTAIKDMSEKQSIPDNKEVTPEQSKFTIDTNGERTGADDNSTAPVQEKQDVLSPLRTATENINRPDAKNFWDKANKIIDNYNSNKATYEEVRKAIEDLYNLYAKEVDAKTRDNLYEEVNKVLNSIQPDRPVLTERQEDTNNLTELKTDVENVEKSAEKYYYKPAISEYAANTFTNFDIANPNYKDIYQYLVSKGAFDYVNKGNLKVGDELTLKYEKIGDYDEVVMYHNDQVVGILPSTATAIKGNYVGLKNVRERVIKGEEIKLNVSKIMLGQFKYTEDQTRPIKDLMNGTPIQLGIVSNRELITNTDLDTEKPYNRSQADGKVYLLLKNSRGTYSPKPVRVKHFNKEEFDLSTLKDTNNSRAREIHRIIDELSKTTNPDKCTELFIDLCQQLYLPNSFHMNIFSYKGTIFLSLKGGPQGTKNINLENNTGSFQLDATGKMIGSAATQADPTHVYNEILKYLYSLNTPFNIDKNEINKGDYNEKLVNDDILYTHLTDTQMTNSWFTTNYYDEEGNQKDAINPKGTFSPVGNKEGTKVTLRNGTTYFVRDGKIYDSSESVVSPKKNIANLIFDLAAAYELNGSAINGPYIYNGITKVNGHYIDVAHKSYANEKQKQMYEDNMNGRPTAIDKMNATLNRLKEDQAKVKRLDNGRPDNTIEGREGHIYQILEDDGQYHEYEGVHNVIGESWKRDENQTPNTLALQYGQEFDDLMRQSFEGDIDAIQKPDNMPNEVFERFKSRAKSLKEYFDNNGEIPIANGIVVFNKIGDKRIAGELDLLTYNKYTGEFRFYDFKTSKYRFYTDEGKLDTHYTTVWHNRQIRSTQEQYTRQLSAYNDLFTSRYGTPIANMALIPLIINYNDKGVTAFNAEPTVNVKYQPSEFMQGTTVSTPKVDNNTIPASNVKTLELSDTKKVKVDISTLPTVTTINGSEIKAYVEEVKSVNNSTKKVTTFYSPYMVFPNGEVAYMNGRRELLNSEELEENKKTWASTIQANKVVFIQAGLVNAKPQEETKSKIQNKGFNNYQYDTEMSINYDDFSVHSTLDRIVGHTAIYKDKNGNDVIILAASSDNSYIGIFKDNTGNWSIKMENKDGNKNFKAQLKEAFDLLPVGAKIYEHTSISVDGLRIFAQQLNHGFSLSNETYEVKVNAGDKANIFGVNDNSDMPLLGQGVKPMKEVRQILKPYLDKFGVSTRDVFSEKDAKSGENIIGISNMPMLVKTSSQLETKPEVNTKYDTNNVFIGGEFGTGTINITNDWIGVSEDPRVWSKDKTVPVFSEVKMKDGSTVTIISYRNAEKFGNNRGTNGIIINVKGTLTDSNKEYIKNTLINTDFSNSKEKLTKQILEILNNSNTKTVTPVTTPTGPQSVEEDLLKAMSLLNTYNKEAPDGTLGEEEIKPRTDVEEQTGRNADGNITVDNPEALKKWNELSNNTIELLRLMNINEDTWNKMLPKQRESELNCLS